MKCVWAYIALLLILAPLFVEGRADEGSVVIHCTLEGGSEWFTILFDNGHGDVQFVAPEFVYYKDPVSTLGDMNSFCQEELDVAYAREAYFEWKFLDTDTTNWLEIVPIKENGKVRKNASSTSFGKVCLEQRSVVEKNWNYVFKAVNDSFLCWDNLLSVILIGLGSFIGFVTVIVLVLRRGDGERKHKEAASDGTEI